MLFNDTYRTISLPTEIIYKEKGSKFIAYAYPIYSEKELKPILSKLRLAHAKANHFCYAYRLTPDRSIYRVNDDGEPSGTAGRPILNMLLSSDLTNILIIVVRYFGGTLLGVSGLINAYKTSANQVISSAAIIEKTVNDLYELKFEYTIMNDVMSLIKEQQINVIDQHFDNYCIIRIEVRKSKINRILQRIEQQPGIQLCYISTC